MFVRMCPHFPFSARVCLNQHHWLANRLTGGRDQVSAPRNAFLKCGDSHALPSPTRSPHRTSLACGQKWLARVHPVLHSPRAARTPACRHRLFLAQVEYCDNLIFHRRAALDALGERLFDANRTIGRPTS